jgi:hypothetical protein
MGIWKQEDLNRVGSWLLPVHEISLNCLPELIEAGADTTNFSIFVTTSSAVREGCPVQAHRPQGISKVGARLLTYCFIWRLSLDATL